MTPRNTIDPGRLAKKAQEVSEILAGLAHPTRLRILCRLCEGEATVAELQEACGLEQAPTSQFLARMRAEKRVSSRREGKSVLYALSDPRLLELMRAIAAIYCNPGNRMGGAA
jgi:DNA-binding transcriptional ArsR family regulator